MFTLYILLLCVPCYALHKQYRLLETLVNSVLVSMDKELINTNNRFFVLSSFIHRRGSFRSLPI